MIKPFVGTDFKGWGIVMSYKVAWNKKKILYLKILTYKELTDSCLKKNTTVNNFYVLHTLSFTGQGPDEKRSQQHM